MRVPQPRTILLPSSKRQIFKADRSTSSMADTRDGHDAGSERGRSGGGEGGAGREDRAKDKGEEEEVPEVIDAELGFVGAGWEG